MTKIKTGPNEKYWWLTDDEKFGVVDADPSGWATFECLKCYKLIEAFASPINHKCEKQDET